jgi:hypothetical protein
MATHGVRTPRRSPLDPSGDAATCPECLQRYAHALEVRCVDCDAPRCPFCVTVAVVGRLGRCRACAAEPER